MSGEGRSASSGGISIGSHPRRLPNGRGPRGPEGGRQAFGTHHRARLDTLGMLRVSNGLPMFIEPR